MSSPRVFSEQEVAEIMQRAVALQEGSGGKETYQAGVTEAELQRAAREMGVDPSFLEQAIREKLEGVTPSKSGLFQGEQRVVEGELDPADFDVVLEQVRVAGRGRHPMIQVGRSLQGRAFTGSGFANLEVTSRNGRTRIDLKPFVVLEALGSSIRRLS